MQDPAQTKLERTFKREVATACLAFVGGLAVYTVLPDDPQLIEARRQVLALLVPPVFLYAGGAFGLDAMRKQLGFGRGGE